MRRWNGWGEESKSYPLHAEAVAFLSSRLREGTPPEDAALEEVLRSVPESKLPPSELYTADPLERLLHARGQSFPDWVALRSGHIGAFPDGVAYPESEQEVRRLLRYAYDHSIRIIPYGGGTSVAGHINPLDDELPTLTVDLSRMTRVLDIDEKSRLAKIQAGARGPVLEAQLRRHGFLLGHYPQSFEYSTLGGWIATRSVGQQSLYYGRIENMFAGGDIETPQGTLRLPALPASAAGPDIRHLVLGSEGRLGILTHAVMRVRPIPETEEFFGAFFRLWDEGIAAVRSIVQEGIPVSMLRLSDAIETESLLALSRSGLVFRLADRLLRLLGYGSDRCLLIYGITGSLRKATFGKEAAEAIIRRHGGRLLGASIGRKWQDSRFLTPYLRNSLWEAGYGVDTLETALPWTLLNSTKEAICASIEEAFAKCDEPVLVTAHLSHAYPDGASLYFTLVFRLATPPDHPEGTLARWALAKSAASRTITEHRGTISHQHGVGADHLPYLVSEKGDVGIRWLEAVSQKADPKSLLNPGKLLPHNRKAKVSP